MKRLFLLAGLLAITFRRQFTAPYSLAGRRVLITGGARGLGLALAREFAAREARLALLARDQGELERAAAELRQAGAEVLILQADVQQGQELEQAIANAAQQWGGLDVLVNNAGVIQAGPRASLELSDYQEAMNVNYFAPLRAMSAALPELTRNKGRILNVASVGGKAAVPHLAAYSASKFALVSLGQSWRAELAQQGVTLTTACPGLMQTGSARNATFKGQQATEYALFATLDNLPGLALRADQAAARMVNALVRGDAEAVIGGPARLLALAQALAPQLLADLLAVGVRFLPGPGHDAPQSRKRRQGHEVESALTRANPLKRRREGEYNEGS
jgi:short-subunit dehydrogenase